VITTANVLSYLIAVASAVIVAMILRLPLLLEKPMRESWTISIIFPTIIIAIGLFAIINYFKVYNNIYTAIVIGIFSAIFSKYLLERTFPKPDLG
jgi:energy-converting hydrogenase A subunit A